MPLWKFKKLRIIFIGLDDAKMYSTEKSNPPSSRNYDISDEIVAILLKFEYLKISRNIRDFIEFKINFNH